MRTMSAATDTSRRGRMAASLVALRVDGGGVSLTRRTGPLRLFFERPDHPAVSVLVRDNPPPSRRASIPVVRDASSVSVSGSWHYPPTRFHRLERTATIAP